MSEPYCCPEAAALISWSTLRRCYLMDVGNMRLLPVYFCPFCGEEL